MTRNFVWLALVACGGTIAPTDDASITDAELTEGTVEAASQTCARIDASNCSNGPNLLNCASGDLGIICMDDAGGNCGFADASCEASCTSDEWAASCGGPPPQVSDPPSSTCRSVGYLPNGGGLYCCPCE